MRLAVLFVALLVLSLSGCGAPPASDGDAGADANAMSDAGGRACGEDRDCNDGLFCNGVETCVDGHCATEVLPCDDGIECTEDFCSEASRNCVSQAPDRDDDGFGDADCLDQAGIAIGNDCDDDDADAFPGNHERCDMHDEDCDPTTPGGSDMDDDGTQPTICCNPSPTAGEPAICGLDCDDTQPNVSRLAPEVCDDIDNDCDTAIDEDVNGMQWPDADRDGYGDASATPVIVCMVASTHASVGGDCNDTDAEVYPTHAEICNGVDDDCDSMIDEGGTAACMGGLTSSTVECISGRCVVTACAGSAFDCNDDPADGCEIDLCNTPAQCGACGQSCGTLVAGYCHDGICGLPHPPVRNVNGRVMDAITGAPIAGATVETIDTCPSATATTRMDGTYTLVLGDEDPRYIRIRHASYATHVQPLETVSSIFTRTIVDAWRADPDAVTADAPTRGIIVVDDLPYAIAVSDDHVSGSNGSVGGDLLPSGSGDRVVFMGVIPGYVQTGGTHEVGAGCVFSCFPDLRAWVEAGAVTHLGSYPCLGAC